MTGLDEPGPAGMEIAQAEPRRIPAAKRRPEYPSTHQSPH